MLKRRKVTIECSSYDFDKYYERKMAWTEDVQVVGVHVVESSSNSYGTIKEVYLVFYK